jgi:hypothetical protein
MAQRLQGQVWRILVEAPHRELTRCHRAARLTPSFGGAESAVRAFQLPGKRLANFLWASQRACH